MPITARKICWNMSNANKDDIFYSKAEIVSTLEYLKKLSRADLNESHSDNINFLIRNLEVKLEL